jgi:hypothetical protein
MVPKTNMIPQDVVPLAVQQAADAHQLGTFLKAHKASLTRTTLGATLFLVGAVLFLAGGIFATDSTTRIKLILLVFGVLFLGQAIFMAYTVTQAVNQQIYLFQQGIVIDKGGQVQPFPWNQTAEVWQSVIRRYRYGIYIGTISLYTLRRLDGYQVKLGNLTKGIAELGPVMTQGITRALVPRALDALQSGQTLTFAPFSINQQGIGNGREWIPWSQVQEIEVSQRWVTVKKVGTSRAWGTALVAKIPNFPVFMAVAEELRRRVGGRQYE